MSEETAAPKAAESSPSATLQVGCAVLVIAMGVFVVVTLNKMKDQLDKLTSTVSAIQETTSSNNVGAFELKNADGEVVMSFVRKPVDMVEGEACSTGEGGACPAPADKAK